jgi:hypothetical protein
LGFLGFWVMGFCEFDGVGLLPYKGTAILAFITIKFD